MSYRLLPFEFARIANHEVLVNEVGDMMVVTEGTVSQMTEGALPKNELYKALVSNYFISDETIPSIMDIYANRLREK